MNMLKTLRTMKNLKLKPIELNGVKYTVKTDMGFLIRLQNAYLDTFNINKDPLKILHDDLGIGMLLLDLKEINKIIDIEQKGNMMLSSITKNCSVVALSLVLFASISHDGLELEEFNKIDMLDLLQLDLVGIINEITDAITPTVESKNKDVSTKK